MASTQLAIRFTDRQIEVLDAMAQEAHTTRSAVVKSLVDQAERKQVAARYRTGYPKGANNVDGFGDLDSFHEAAQTERREGRRGERQW